MMENIHFVYMGTCLVYIFEVVYHKIRIWVLLF
jgi:hypothetical protein